MPKPHKHSEVIKAWANGYKVQTRRETRGKWMDEPHPSFYPEYQYRIKPDVTRVQYRLYMTHNGKLGMITSDSGSETHYFSHWLTPLKTIVIDNKN